MPKVIIFVAIALLCALFAQGQPLAYDNPKADVEYISDGAQHGPKPNIVPVTRPPLLNATPPPVAPNSKTFAYDPKTQTWTSIKRTDPQPDEDVLLWNQSNDKWLTKVPPQNA